MKVTGFSFIKNAEKYQYPIVEAIRSILPLCDEVIVAVGESQDNTRALVSALGPKVRIIDTKWDDNVQKGGQVLALETDKAFKAIPEDTDWCVYIQGDEVMHEQGHPAVREAMERWKDNKEVDGLLFKYRHFFGSYDYIGTEGRWFRNEIRVIKNNRSIYSYRDAQGFRKGDNKKLNVKPVNTYIHHYGWVQDPRTMVRKFLVKEKIYFGRDNGEDVEVPDNLVAMMVNSLTKFKGTHPEAMKERVKKIGWDFKYDESANKTTAKDRFKNLIEKITGKRPFDYQNYKII